MTEKPARERVCALATCHVEPPSRDFLVELKQHVRDVVVVSDGKPAGEAGMLRALAEQVGVEVLMFESNRGKGHAVSEALRGVLGRESPPTAVLVIDGDGQHPPSVIPRFLGVDESVELVIGDRFGDLAAMPWHRRRANRAASWLLARSTGQEVRDSQCGMRLLRGRALGQVPFPPGGYEAETTHLKRCLQAGVRVSWVPVPAVYEGQPSSFRSVRDSLRIVAAIFR